MIFLLHFLLVFCFSNILISRSVFDGYLSIILVNIHGLVYFTLVMFLRRDYEVVMSFCSLSCKGLMADYHPR